MATWPTEPVWTDPTTLNKGNEYNASDGVTSSDMNAIIQNLQYLKVNGGSSGGISINGVIEQYKVNAGATVNAGDFVEFVTSWTRGSISPETPTTLKAVSLSIDIVAVVYIATNAIKGIVAQIGDGEITTLYEGNLLSSTGSEYAAIDVDVINSTDIVIGFCCTTTTTDDSGTTTVKHDTKCTVMRFGNNYTTVTSGSRWGWNAQGTSIRVLYLHDGYMICARRYLNDGNAYYAQACFYCNLETLQFSSSGVSISASSFWTDKNSDNQFGLTKVDETHYWFTYLYQYRGGSISNPTTKRDLRSNLMKLNSNTIVSQDEKVLYSNYRASTNPLYEITNGNASYTVAHDGIWKKTYSDGTISTSLVASVYLGYIHDVTIVNNRLLVLGETAIYSFALSDFTYKSTQIQAQVIGSFAKAPSESEVIVISSVTDFATGGLAAAGVYSWTYIVGNDGTITEKEARIGTSVQPATSRLHNVGVAKTGGSEGDTIEVYCV